MRIVITGASGLLGSYLTPLLSLEHEVFAMSRRPVTGARKTIPIDLSAAWDDTILPTHIDVVIHLAQSSEYRNFPEGALDVFNVNLSTTAKLLNYAAASGAHRFILASSGGIYRSGVSPITEKSDILGPSELNNYFASKLASEIFAGTYRGFMGVNVLRIFFMYGKNQRSSMFLPALATRIRKGSPVSLNGPNGISVNPVHAEDVAAAVLEMVRNGGPDVLNAAGPEITSIRGIAEMLEPLVGVSARYDIQPPAPDIVADPVSFATILPKEPIPISEGIRSLFK